MDWLNVIQHGVHADGFSDDTAAIQNCLDYMKDGGTIYFPDGVYLVSASLIFYSNQVLKFSDNAIIRRNENASPLTRYLLASYSEKDWSKYNGTHDVVISGGIFDGNENLTEKSTLINTVHCKNIVIENCRFINCSVWHFIELNSTCNAVVRNCVFNGQTYTAVSDELHNEMIQLDRARFGSYGPVYDAKARQIEFCFDDTTCRDILITDNIFKCDGFPAIGHHDNCEHRNITVSNNIFDGTSGRFGVSRGYIFFRPSVTCVKVVNNAFFNVTDTNSPNVGMIFENPDEAAVVIENNCFTGDFDDRAVIGNHKYFTD